MEKITKEQFEIRYAHVSNKSIEEIKEMGLTAVPCDCEQEGCMGWQMKRMSFECSLCNESIPEGVWHHCGT